MPCWYHIIRLKIGILKIFQKFKFDNKNNSRKGWKTLLSVSRKTTKAKATNFRFEYGKMWENLKLNMIMTGQARESNNLV